MWPSAIIKSQIAAERGALVWDRATDMEIELLVFHRAPQAFDKHIIPPGAAAVHAYMGMVKCDREQLGIYSPFIRVLA